MLTLQAMDTDFHKVGEVSLFQSLSMTRSYYGTGSIDITADPRAANVLKLLPDTIVFLSGRPDRAYLIEDIVTLTRAKLQVRGCMLKGVTKRRVCVPPISLPARLWQYDGTAWVEITDSAAIAAAITGGTVYQGLSKPGAPTSGMMYLDLTELSQGYDWGTSLAMGQVISDLQTAQLRSRYQNFGWDRFTGDAESAILHYVGNNLIAPEYADRAIPFLVAGDNLHRGAELPWQARFDKLDAMLQSIGEATGIGYDVALDLDNARIVLSAWQGMNRTGGSVACLVSEKNGNAAEVTLKRTTSASATTCYVGGSGEDENRLILAVGGTVPGLARREMWAEAGSIDDPALLTLYGQNKLDAAAEKRTLTADLIDSGACRYERDYDVGDVVVVRDVYGNSQNARITDVTETYENGKRTLKATFGDAAVSITAALSRSGSAAR